MTPIRKITEDPLENYGKKKLVLSQVEKDSEVREIKMNKNNQKVSPLLRESFVRKKLMQTIKMDPQR